MTGQELERLIELTNTQADATQHYGDVTVPERPDPARVMEAADAMANASIELCHYLTQLLTSGRLRVDPSVN